MSRPDVLFLNTIGPGFTSESVRRESIGGSELEITQIAEALAKKGYACVVANNIPPKTPPSMSEGVTYISAANMSADYLPTQALYIERTSQVVLPAQTYWPPAIVVRATDFYWPGYDIWKDLFRTSKTAILAVNSEAQATAFAPLLERKRMVIIPPILGEMPKVEKIPGRFVYASAPCKGLKETVEAWTKLHARRWTGQGRHRNLELHLSPPGHATGERIQLTLEHMNAHVMYDEAPTIEEYRKKIAQAEGLFFVNTMPETFCCAAAFAQRSQTRIHMWCVNGLGGVLDALNPQNQACNGVTMLEEEFSRYFLSLADSDRSLDSPALACAAKDAVDCSAATLGNKWESALGLRLDRRQKILEPTSQPPWQPGATVDSGPGPSAAYDFMLTGPTVVGGTMATAPPLGPSESSFSPETAELWPNRTPFSEPFGPLLSTLKAAIGPGGSEFGVYLGLFALAVSTRASTIVELGRFKGGATFALASALKLLDEGWVEPKIAEQRPDIDYDKFIRSPKSRRLVSIDPHRLPEAETIIHDNSLKPYVKFVDALSKDVAHDYNAIDLLFIDGDHSYEGVLADIRKFVPEVRKGGYFVLHDIFGWYTPDKQNGSPITKAIDEVLQGFENVLWDTGFASMRIFRKTKELDALPIASVPARADGRPTVGLVMIARQEGPMLARALMSAKKLDLDAITVVIDTEGTPSDIATDIAKQFGADVHVRPTPAVDWEKGDGFIARARNEALAIAEQKTDFLLALDPDDAYEGSLPARLEADAFKVRIADGATEYARAQLFRSKKGFRYAGIRHEVLQHPPGSSVGAQVVPGLIYRRIGGGSFQDRDTAHVKFLKHAKDLERWLFDHPEDPRAAFYCAQSYRDSCKCNLPGLNLPGGPQCTCGGLTRSAYWYEKRVNLGGWEEERWFSALQLAIINAREGRDPVSAYMRAYALRPCRAETLWQLAVWLRDDLVKRYDEAYLFARQCAEIVRPPDELFVESDLYVWKAVGERAICGYWARQKQDSVVAAEMLQGRVPSAQKDWAANLLRLCREGRP